MPHIKELIRNIAAAGFCIAGTIFSTPLAVFQPKIMTAAILIGFVVAAAGFAYAAYQHYRKLCAGVIGLGSLINCQERRIAELNQSLEYWREFAGLMRQAEMEAAGEQEQASVH